VTQTVAVGGCPVALAYGDGSVWVANSLDGTVSRIDPTRGAVEATVRVGNGPDGVTVSRAGIWVTNEFDGSVALIDPRRNAVVRRDRLGGKPTAVASAARSSWIAVREQGSNHRGGTLVLLASEPSFETLDPRFLTSLQAPQLRGMTNDGLLTFKHAGGSDGTQLVPDLACWSQKLVPRFGAVRTGILKPLRLSQPPLNGRRTLDPVSTSWQRGDGWLAQVGDRRAVSRVRLVPVDKRVRSQLLADRGAERARPAAVHDADRRQAGQRGVVD
jgi:YVTN family beta-propeller protein